MTGFDDEFYVETDLGNSGPFREASAPDPTFVPPPFLGFSVYRFEPPVPNPLDEVWAQVRHADRLRVVETADGRTLVYPEYDMPQLWDGDQA